MITISEIKPSWGEVNVVDGLVDAMEYLSLLEIDLSQASLDYATSARGRGGAKLIHRPPLIVGDPWC